MHIVSRGGYCPGSRGVGVLLILVQGVNRLLWAGLGSAGPLQSPTPASQSGAGRQGGHTGHTCCGHVCVLGVVHVAVSTRESRVL